MKRLVSVIAAILSLPAAAMAGPLIDAAAAAAALTSGDDVVLLDARRPADRALLRVRGSIYCDYGDWLRRNRRDPAGSDVQDQWRHDLADLGIGEATTVLIAGGRGSYNAPATVWYALQGVGVARVAVIDGGFEALAGALPGTWLDWSPEPVGPDAPAMPRADTLEPRSVAVHAAPAWKDEVLAIVTRGGPRLIDARSADEFAGVNDTRNPRPGHVPGALNLPHGLLRTEDGRVASPEAIRGLLATHGIDPDEPLVVYCQGGGRSAFATFALVHAGFDAVRNYFGSFGEWSQDEDCPVATEPTPLAAPAP